MKFLDPRAIKDWIKSRAVNSMMATEKGFFMDARQGPVIREELDDIQTGLNEINSKLVPQDVTQTLFAGVSFIGKTYTQNKRLYVQGYYKKQAFTVGWQELATLPFSCDGGFQSVVSGWRGGSNPVNVSGIVGISGNRLRTYVLENNLQEITVNFSFPI